MSIYSVDEIARWELGKNGLCVIVEGESQADDPDFFYRWFGGNYPTLTFYNQNGYTRVAEAVADLRTKLPFGPAGKPRVYGITDRDFKTPYPGGTMPEDGVLRMSKCMLENYFLDPQPWSAYLWDNVRRKALRGDLNAQIWSSQTATLQNFQTEIERIYRANLEVSAYNWMLCAIKQHFQDSSQPFPGEFPKDLDFPAQYNAQKLAEFARISGVALTKIEQVFRERLEMLRNMPTSNLSRHVQGKALYQQFVVGYLRTTLKISGEPYDIAAEAMRYCTQPPQDLEAIIAFIEQYANTP